MAAMTASRTPKLVRAALDLLLDTLVLLDCENHPFDNQAWRMLPGLLAFRMPPAVAGERLWTAGTGRFTFSGFVKLAFHKLQVLTCSTFQTARRRDLFPDAWAIRI